MSDFASGIGAAIDIGSQRCCLGSIARLTAGGQPIVTYPGCPAGGIAAKVLAGGLLQNTRLAGEVELLLFPDGESQPIVLGCVSATTSTDTGAVPRPVSSNPSPALGRPDALLADSKRIVIDAQNEILLRCGESSILLRRDGKIVVKGKRIVNRASETNKIRGGSVLIN